MAPVVSNRSFLARRLTAAIATPVVILLVLGVVLARQIIEMSDDARSVEHSDTVIAIANETFKQIIDQETGLRGYQLTGERVFLGPFNRAHPLDGFKQLHDLTVDKPQQQARFDDARWRYERWLAATRPSVEGTAQNAAKTTDVMLEWKTMMDSEREAMRGALEVEENLRNERSAASQASRQRTQVVFVVLLAVSAAALAFVSRGQLRSIARAFGDALDAETKAREATETEVWIRAGQAKLADAMQGDRALEQLGAELVGTLATYVRADVAALFTRDNGVWKRRGGYALDSRAGGPSTFADGEGLVGQTARAGEMLHLHQVPDDAPKVRSGTTDVSPRDLVLLPARVDGETTAVIELGFLRAADERSLELLGRVGESVAMAVRSSEYKQRLRDLLEETQRQAEELQQQQEELRVSNEELEAQTTALRATQAQLEAQQAELESTNDNLLSQRALLENQNALLEEKQAEVTTKARELERASQFKSDFLSNMSHELRTPLNSSLILAKLLADNREGNLTGEQVEFARTIQSAGNDLLTLVNDVLDLSKIEAGKMDVRAAPVPLDRIRANLARTFDAVAHDKGLRFSVEIAASSPPTIETDAQRLEQILKNLVSNALKFTEQGEVAVAIAGAGDHITFSVRDTGIGIEEAQRGVIFEAFRQADGTTKRKHGGTGLGLSISRELAHLLGGEIEVRSKLGEGSTFTLSLPRSFTGPLAAAEPARSAVAESARPPSIPSPRIMEKQTNGTSHLDPEPEAAIDPSRRLVLVIEDDEAFAGILAGVAREADFECLVAGTAEEGFRLAKKHAPAGIVLDMKLPDHIGLSVLDRLKRDPVTRHIPVHVMSAVDHVERALSMGAAAYLLKPVERDRLLEALHRIAERSGHHLRRVLVVDDDPVLRESVSSLLGRSDVEICTAASGAEALALLRERTFDCVVTDLGLPDQNGFELLETMAGEEPYSVPPVIVYTGRVLTTDEEQRLRKYSRSIIVKGARSPERLLDEVTLFLHQVESELPPEQQRLLRQARHREAVFEGRTVLVVEDDVRNVFALTSALEPKGARVKIARNGLEALSALEAEPAVDLVLMDVMMPEMDGLEATRRIRQNPRWTKLPVIALTAKAMRDDREKCLQAGANDYLPKPLDVEMLLSLLRVWMPKP